MKLHCQDNWQGYYEKYWAMKEVSSERFWPLHTSGHSAGACKMENQMTKLHCHVCTTTTPNLEFSKLIDNTDLLSYTTEALSVPACLIPCVPSFRWGIPTTWKWWRDVNEHCIRFWNPDLHTINVCSLCLWHSAQWMTSMTQHSASSSAWITICYTNNKLWYKSWVHS